MNVTLRLFLLLATLVWTTNEAAAIPGRAEVIKVVGKATATDANGASKSITQGMVLGTGDTITTGAASAVDLNLGLNGDFLRVDPDTSLKLENLDIANVAQRTVTTQLNVNRGGITGNVVSKLSVASKYEIKTVGGVAGIRGTKYSITTDANGRISSIIVTQGTVTFFDRGVTVTISAADGTAKAYTPSAAGQAVNQTVDRATTAQISSVTTVGTQVNTADNTTTTTVQNPADVSTSQRQ